MNILYRLCLAALIIPSSLVENAWAQENNTANSWGVFNMAIYYSGDGYSKKRRAKIDKGEAIYSTSTRTNGAMLSCLEGNFYGALALKPQDLRKSFKKSTVTHRLRRVYYTLDGGSKKPLGKWIHKPTLDIIASFKRSQAAKIYNAAIRGQKVTIYIEGKKPIALDLPKPNQTFAEFGSECGLGVNPKKK